MTSKLLLRAAVFSLLVALLFFSCKKEPEVIPNQTPLADGGPDQLITFQQDSVHLDGSSSTDADGTITTYKWEKIAGPQRFTILSANTPKTTVTDLEGGVYEFQLTVTDNLGHSSKDVVQVTVQRLAPCNGASVRVVSGPGELKEFGSLSLPRFVHMSAVADKMVFAGGNVQINGGYAATDRMDIYNFTTKAWTTEKLRAYIQQGITVGNKILFIREDGKLDLYDAQANSWTALSSNLVAGLFLSSTAVLGSKVFFAGGFTHGASMEVHIYDAASNTWSVAQLSEARGAITIAAVGNKLVFAGGYKTIDYDDNLIDPSKKVDIYDGATNTWSSADLPLPVLNGSAAVIGSKAVFTSQSAEDVFVFDAIDNRWSTATLSRPRLGTRAMSVGNKILVAGGFDANGDYSSRVDIYDPSTGSWSVANMSRPGSVNWWAGVGNQLLLSVWTDNVNGNDVAFDVYDAGSNTFTPVQLSHRLITTPVVADGKLYFGGALVGAIGNNEPYPSCKVWQFEFK
jgi:N-acetylneuraminic acid mutarotase